MRLAVGAETPRSGSCDGLMCNQYSPSDPQLVALHFKVEPLADPCKRGIGPWGRGPFVRAVLGDRAAVVGQLAPIGDKVTVLIQDGRGDRRAPLRRSGRTGRQVLSTLT